MNGWRMQERKSVKICNGEGRKKERKETNAQVGENDMICLTTAF